VIWQAYGRREFHYLLAPPLQAAVAIAEYHHRARTISEDLDLDMTGILDKCFGIETAVAERRDSFASTAFDCFGEIIAWSDDAHAAASPTRDRLQHHRPCEGLHHAVEVGDAADAAVSGHRNALALGESNRGRLVAELCQDSPRRADEHDPCVFARFGERWLFAGKSIAGMNGIAPSFNCSANNLLNIEVGRWSLTRELDRVVGPRHVQRSCVI